MAIKFQYNKTSLNDLNKQLKVRTNALPTLKNKESALRVEVKRAKSMSDELMEKLDASLKAYEYLAAPWNEFTPGLISVKDVVLKTEKIAGVKTPALVEVLYEVNEFDIYREKMRILDYTREKATQKVNLYEKVQIPGYKEAIRKIKRYMEDEENLSKASQKIVKTRHLIEEEENND